MKVVIQYDVVDEAPASGGARIIRETHRWVADGETTLKEIIEWVGNSPNIDTETVRIFHAGEWERD